jgi:hypothetical protein
LNGFCGSGPVHTHTPGVLAAAAGSN